MEKRTVVIVGATGSIGLQTLDVLSKLTFFKLIGITYHSNEELAMRIAKEYKIENIVCTMNGLQKLFELFERLRPDITVVCVPGFVSLPITLKAIECCKRVLLASKEALVCGGWLVRSWVRKFNVELLPVDSEHNALFQIIEKDVEKVLITSSGGALRDWKLEDLEKATVKDVLNHPVWKMGKRITVDSATMVNKAFEVLEACELFSLQSDQVEVLIHRQGIVHAAVFLKDGTVKMHVGYPDMRIPIAFALTYPHRYYSNPTWPDLISTPLSFGPVDQRRYPCFHIVYEISKDYAKRTAYNAADEVAVNAFLNGRIKFTDICKVIIKVVEKTTGTCRDLKDLEEIDQRSRILAEEVIKCL
ncbi:1-deoxy-D-xylulose-5-phosphate reductoisomerase [Pseudothermotoga thermarum]|uniref:1-deoxy-D-xylulose 5-phosphate reductoisomerase n=1 Tax=Pseudothermotoga thermarum DSM 5069 TaxID=688269 RepID=F7YYW4_9THEM|nr:1-deoxy-D-xylulose-5-phosphate reductoisomerase [Pseudothermotoga thermarum]AEH51158.1 1-deoxy-D-xylulose 5-phosphate reductoisomerase [Pseudothermotoga thermarum DSM 5069]